MSKTNTKVEYFRSYVECHKEIDAESEFCPFCGAVLMRSSGKDISIKTKDKGNEKPVKMTVWLMVGGLLMLAFIIRVYLFLVLPLWFLGQRKYLNKLHSKQKISTYPFVGAYLIFILVEFIAHYLVIKYSDYGTSLLVLISGLLFIHSIFIYQSLKIKNVLVEHFKDYQKKGVKISNLWTILFGFLYLQLEVNKLFYDE